jgi:hypothetical protein
VGLFGRRVLKRDDQFDPILAPLSIADAALLRRSVQRWLAEHGREAVMAADHVKVDGLLGLTNLARLCAQQPGGSAAWPAIIEAHLATLLGAMADPVDVSTLSPDDLAQRVMLRLWPDDTVGMSAGSVAGWADVAPGLVQTLVLDEANNVRTIAVGEAATFDERLLLEAGRNNFARSPYQRHIVEWQDVRIDVLRGDSTYSASQLLVLAELLAQMYPDRVASSGVLIAVPDRSMLMVHIIDGDTGSGVLAAMRRYARERHGRVPWALSPHVYWWHDGDLSIADASQRSDLAERATDETYSVFERAVAATEPVPGPTTSDVAARETDSPGIDPEQFPPAAREVLSIALELCADQITGGIKKASSFNPFVVMGTRYAFDLVLIDHAETFLTKDDPFLFMQKFMARPNQFAIMAVAARLDATGAEAAYTYVVVMQIEHAVGTSVRLAIPYRITPSGDPRFGPALPDHRVPSNWPVWNQGLEPTP